MQARLTVSTNANMTNSKTLPTPVDIKPSWNALDSAKSGRDNNTGLMFRDKITDKQTWAITIPYGVTHSELADVLTVIKRGSFYAKVFDVLEGDYAVKPVYCSKCEPPIAKATANAAGTDVTGWIYDEFSLNFIEM